MHLADPNIFNVVLLWPIINVLVIIYQALMVLHIPYALGFAIIVLTIVIRLLLYPLTATQIKASKKMQDLSPHLSKLKETHKGDAKRLQQETMRLYKEHGVNPAAGCIPVLIQLPLLWALYSVLHQVITLNSKEVVKVINEIVYFDAFKLTSVWNTNFFGLPLAQNPSSLLQTVGPLILLVPILTALLQFAQSKMMIPHRETDKKEKKKKEEDFATMFQSQSTYIFPALIGFLSFTFPIGLSLYWNTFTIFGILQQYRMYGLGSLTGLKNRTTNLWQKTNKK